MSLDEDKAWGQSPSFKINPSAKSSWMIFRCLHIFQDKFLMNSLGHMPECKPPGGSMGYLTTGASVTRDCTLGILHK